jgi:hypothetical protein
VKRTVSRQTPGQNTDPNFGSLWGLLRPPFGSTWALLGSGPPPGAILRVRYGQAEGGRSGPPFRPAGPGTNVSTRPTKIQTFPGPGGPDSGPPGPELGGVPRPGPEGLARGPTPTPPAKGLLFGSRPTPGEITVRSVPCCSWRRRPGNRGAAAMRTLKIALPTQTRKLNCFLFSTILDRFAAKLGPRTPPDGPGSKNGAQST